MGWLGCWVWLGMVWNDLLYRLEGGVTMSVEPTIVYCYGALLYLTRIDFYLNAYSM